VNPIAQATSYFSFEAGTADQKLAITKFSASATCGDSVWTYSGFD
jgi:hypothetical protein